MPSPSLPMTMAAGTLEIGAGRAPYRRRPPCRRPRRRRSFSSRIVLTRFATRATGIYSSAPAEALPTTAVRPTLRRLGMMTPCAPAHSAVRMIAPRLCGSDSSSQMTMQRRPRPVFRGAFEDVVDRGVVMRGDDGDDALVRARGGELVELAPVGLDDDGAGLLSPWRPGAQARGRYCPRQRCKPCRWGGLRASASGHGVAALRAYFLHVSAGSGLRIAPELARAAVIVSVFHSSLVVSP